MIEKLRRRLAIVLTLLTGLILAGALGLGLINVLQEQQKNSELEFSLKISNLYGYILSTYLGGGKADPAMLTAFEKENKMFLHLEKNEVPVEFEPGIGTPEEREELFAAAKNLYENLGQTAIDSASVGGYYFQTMSVAELPLSEVPQEAVEGTASEAVSSAVVSEDLEMGTASSESVQIAQEAPTEVYVGAAGDEWAVTIQTDGSGIFLLENQQGQKYRWVAMPVYLNSEIFINAIILQDISAELGQRNVTILLFVIFFLAGTILLWLVSSLFAKILLKSTAEGIQRQSDFVAAASHELRSPLTVIRASLSAAENAADEQEAKKYSKAAVAEAERMSRLVNDLLLLAGGDARSWKVQREQLDLDTLLIETSEQFAPIAKKSGLTLLLNLPEETLPAVAGDADRMRQILAVLLNNAIQYAPHGSELLLTARHRKNKVEIDVVDHGNGLPEEEKQKVFERFYRVDKSRTDKERFGLGLPVAKELTELHGGSISVQDTPGGGATFRVTLPVLSGKELAQRETNDLPQ